MKPAKTIDEQLDILANRGLRIDDKEKAGRILRDVNYYTLTGYLFPFEKSGVYTNDISFEKMVELYQFDTRIRKILLSLVSEAETMIKTRIAYSIAMLHRDDPLIYTDINYFNNAADYTRFIADFQTSVRNNNEIPFVKHHISKYRSQFPIWVAVELLTLGNIKYFYKNIPSKDWKEISKTFNVSPTTFDSWIDCLRIVRNRLAHNMRLYDTTFKNTPRFEKHHILKSENNRLFSSFILLKYLLHNHETWSESMEELDIIMVRYHDTINLKKIGFPTNWKILLDD